MKKFFLAALFSTALSQVAFAGVYSNDPYYDDYPPEPKTVEISEYQLTHNSFFMQLDLGLAAQSVSGYIHKGGKTVGTGFDGEGLGATFNLGLNVKRWYAAYIGFGFVEGTGHASFDGTREKVKNFDFYSLNFHIGTVLFPFRNVPGMEGFFAGLELGVGGVETSNDDDYAYDDLVNESTFTFKIEAGHVWDLTPRWGIGVKGFISFNGFIEDSYYDDDYYYYYGGYEDYYMRDLSGVSIGIMATLIRR